VRAWRVLTLLDPAQGNTLDAAQGVQSWYDEILGYDFSTGACNTNIVPMCGHYTQVVWADSLTLGCGAADCSAGGLSGSSLPNTFGGPQLLVCNYAPPGNVGAEKPYSVGATCADCAAACSAGLCTSTPSTCADQESFTFTLRGVPYSSCESLLAGEPTSCSSSWQPAGQPIDLHWCPLTVRRQEKHLLRSLSVLSCPRLCAHAVFAMPLGVSVWHVQHVGGCGRELLWTERQRRRGFSLQGQQLDRQRGNISRGADHGCNRLAALLVAKPLHSLRA
jgi:hypothetical protein